MQIFLCNICILDINKGKNTFTTSLESNFLFWFYFDIILDTPAFVWLVYLFSSFYPFMEPICVFILKAYFC